MSLEGLDRRPQVVGRGAELPLRPQQRGGRHGDARHGRLLLARLVPAIARDLHSDDSSWGAKEFALQTSVDSGEWRPVMCAVDRAGGADGSAGTPADDRATAAAAEQRRCPEGCSGAAWVLAVLHGYSREGQAAECADG